MSSTLRVSYTLTWDPEEVAGGAFDLKNGTKLFLHGGGISILDDILEALDLTTETKYGELNTAFLMVANGTADIGALLTSHAPLWIKYGLGSTVVFLHPLVKETSYVYFRQPPTENFKITMLRPFSPLVWLAFLALLVFVTVLLTQLVTLKDHKKTWFHFPKHFLVCMLNTIEIYFGRYPFPKLDTLNENKHPLVGGIIKLITTFTTLFILTIYTAKVASVFMIQDDIVLAPSDLLKYKYKLSTYSSIHIDRMFENPQTREMVVAQVEPKPVDLHIIENVIGKGKDPRQAIFSFSDGFYPQALFRLGYLNELCDVSSFKSSVKTPRSFYARKDSPYREIINIKILQLIERGLNHRHQANHVNKFKYSCPSKMKPVEPLTIHHVSLAFIILAFGMCIGISLNYETCLFR